MIDLDFSVVGAQAVAFSALPTLALELRIDNRDEASIRAISLVTQVRIGPHMRSYADEEQQHLIDLFGEPARWGQTLRSLLWTMTSTVGSTRPRSANSSGGAVLGSQPTPNET